MLLFVESKKPKKTIPLIQWKTTQPWNSGKMFTKILRDKRFYI